MSDTSSSRSEAVDNVGTMTTSEFPPYLLSRKVYIRPSNVITYGGTCSLGGSAALIDDISERERIGYTQDLSAADEQARRYGCCDGMGSDKGGRKAYFLGVDSTTFGAMVDDCSHG